MNFMGFYRKPGPYLFSMRRGQPFLCQTNPLSSLSSASLFLLSILTRGLKETLPTYSNSLVCHRNWVSRSNFRNWVQWISGENCWPYCERIGAWLNPCFRTACSIPALASLKLETHSLDHTSHNDTRKSAYLLLSFAFPRSARSSLR